MKLSVRAILASALLTVVLAGGLRAGASNVTDISFTAGALNGTWCPGDPVNVSFQICGTNPFSIQPGKFYIFMQDTAVYPALSCNLPNSGDAATWLVVGDNGVQNPPTHTYPWGSAPVAGGYNANMTTTTCKTFSFNFNLPPDTAYGHNYRIMIKLDDNYASQTSSPCDPHEVPFTSCLPSTTNSSLQKSVEGTATVGEIMLYWLDYSFLNSVNNVVKDSIPFCINML